MPNIFRVLFRGQAKLLKGVGPFMVLANLLILLAALSALGGVAFIVLNAFDITNVSALNIIGLFVSALVLGVIGAVATAFAFKRFYATAPDVLGGMMDDMDQELRTKGFGFDKF